MYDFTHCISDALEGITHSICTLEFQDNRRLYDWVLENITIENRPHQYEFSRLNLEYAITSKRKLLMLVQQGIVDGWDDPRMTTISGLRRRGYTPASIREFCKRIGVSKQDNNVEYSALESCIREDLNENAMRRMAVLDHLKVVIENYPENEIEQLDGVNHPLKPELGSRKLPFSREIFIEKDDFREEANKKFKRLVLGKEVRLRYAYIIKAERCDKDENGNITCVYCTYIPDSLGKDVPDHKPKGVIHWVDANENADVEVRLYKNLFNTPKPGDADDFLSTINEESLKIISNAKAEKSLAQASVGESFQFERTGYFCVDSKYSTDTKKVFNLTVALKEDAAKASV
jgi:glutaminyl-tRNA synthetase